MKQSTVRLLVADDDPAVLEALRLLLKGENYAVETATSPGGILAAVESRDFDALLMDMNYTRDTTSGTEGLDLLRTLQTLEPDMPLVVMTAWGTIDNAVAVPLLFQGSASAATASPASLDEGNVLASSSNASSPDSRGKPLAPVLRYAQPRR